MKYKKITLSEDEIIIPKNIAKKLMYLISGSLIFFFLITGSREYFEYRVSKKIMNPIRIENYYKITPEKLTLKEKKAVIHYATSKSIKRIEALIYYGNVIRKLQEELNNGDLEAKKQLEEWEDLLK